MPHRPRGPRAPECLLDQSSVRRSEDGAIENNQAKHYDPNQGGDRQRHGRTHRSRALGYARRHGAVRTTSVAVCPDREDDDAACGDPRAITRPQRRGISQHRTLQNRGEQQTEDNHAMHDLERTAYVPAKA